MRLLKEKWNFKSLDEVHQAANSVLRFSMFNERSKRWPKVAEGYKRLLWLVDKNHFPKDYEPPSSYAILMYEIHYHLGVALQRLDQHRKAIAQFTKAIESVSIPKGGCLAGCVTNSCLMTPVFARRAFAYAKVGDLRSALRDADNSVVLDSQNPDVFCIRALVRGSRDEEKLAIRDVDEGLKLNPSHVCALIIRGALSRTLSTKKATSNLLAERLNPESQSFNSVSSFYHPCLLDFYDRFLFTLSVPHTITTISLTPDKPSTKQLESNPELYSRTASRAGSAHSQSPWAPAEISRREPIEPFRCGTPAAGDNKSAAMRRKDYGEAVRKFMARPKTASEFLTQLEKERSKRNALEQSQRQRSSSVVQGMTSFPVPSDYGTHSTTPLGRSSSATCPGKTSLSTSLQLASRNADRPSDRGSARSELLSPKSSAPLDVVRKTPSGRTTRTTCTKTFTFETPTNYSIPVFQPLNIKDAPRMYYRPWKGDKLPVADVARPVTAPAFY